MKAHDLHEIPSPECLFAAIDATWAPAHVVDRDGWRLRKGAGGGKRVSAATARSPEAEIGAAERGMETLGQPPVFMIRPEDSALDAALAAQGYKIIDPVQILIGRAADIARNAPSREEAIPALNPLAVQKGVWEEGGVGAARLAVMERVSVPKTTLAGRLAERVVATAFVAVDGPVAMLHALYVSEAGRRNGIGTALTRAAAEFGVRSGAEWFAILVEESNAPARALYSGLGMRPATRYHYRVRP